MRLGDCRTGICAPRWQLACPLGTIALGVSGVGEARVRKSARAGSPGGQQGFRPDPVRGKMRLPERESRLASLFAGGWDPCLQQSTRDKDLESRLA